jgi:hypothetical protein
VHLARGPISSSTSLAPCKACRIRYELRTYPHPSSHRMVLAGSLMGEEAATERIPVQQAKASSAD